MRNCFKEGILRKFEGKGYDLVSKFGMSVCDVYLTKVQGGRSVLKFGVDEYRAGQIVNEINFLREFEEYSCLPKIKNVYDCGLNKVYFSKGVEKGGFYVLEKEYIDGDIFMGGREGGGCGDEIFDLMNEAHSRGYSNFDFARRNLILGKNGKVYLIDAGSLERDKSEIVHNYDKMLDRAKFRLIFNGGLLRRK